jgi:hypothetical protein
VFSGKNNVSVPCIQLLLGGNISPAVGVDDLKAGSRGPEDPQRNLLESYMFSVASTYFSELRQI